jgi:hypothetical protein
MVIALADGRQHRQVRLGRRQRHPHRRHQRDQAIDWQVVEMADARRVVRSRIHDLGEGAAFEQPYQPHEIEATPQLRAGKLEIDHLGDARLSDQEVLCATRRRRRLRRARRRI